MNFTVYLKRTDICSWIHRVTTKVFTEVTDQKSQEFENKQKNKQKSLVVHKSKFLVKFQFVNLNSRESNLK